MLAYVLDDSLQNRLNGQGLNHWDVYHREIANQLGVTAVVLSLADLENSAALASMRTLIIGAQSGAKLTDAACATLRHWVQQGGLLIGYAVAGLDDVFGIQIQSTIEQPVDDYTISAYVQFHPHPLAREIHPFMHIEQKLFTLSDVQQAARRGCEEVAGLYDLEGNSCERPAITWRACGKGFAAWFAFDVAKTIWLLHQGRPLPRIPERAFALRTPQLQVLAGNSTKIAYADELVHLLANMIAVTRQPFIYAIPPDGDQVPDALLYYSGDEYVGPVEDSIKASQFMKSRGLGYHINIAPHLHPMTREQFDSIRANGHEVSAYMWLWTPDKKGSIISPENFKMQCDALRQRFGVNAGAVLVGSCQWQGWSETARWLAEAGATADNTFVGWAAISGQSRRDTRMRYGHPWYNGPFFGFGFGTCFPFFFYDDAQHGNERLSLQEQPIICYEVGHRGSIMIDEAETIRDTQTVSPEDIHEPIDRAVRYHLVMNVFYHPAYIVHFPHCRAAIDELKRYIAYKGAHVLHWGNNAAADWWNAREASCVTEIDVNEKSMAFTSDCHWRDGMILRIQWNAPPPACVFAGNVKSPIPHQIKREFGQDWLYLVVPSGAHRISVESRA